MSLNITAKTVSNMQNICPKCSQYFECLESTNCWCYGLKKYHQIEEIQDCICNNCLLAKDNEALTYRSENGNEGRF
jgi:hypothetical protein